MRRETGRPRRWLLAGVGLPLLAGLLLCLPRFVAGSQSEAAASFYNEGNRLYREGHYEQATQSYQRALDMGVRDPRLEYNLGCAEAKAGHLGRARLRFERALRLAPGDSDVRRNLAIVRARVPGEVQPLEAGPLLEGLLSLYRGLRPVALLWWLAGGWALFWLAWGGALLAPRGGSRNLKTLQFVIVFSLVGLGTIFYAKHRETSRPYAVVVGKQATIRGGPSTEEAELLTLSPGRRILAGRERGAWIEVWVPDEFEGWLPREAVELVNP